MFSLRNLYIGVMLIAGLALGAAVVVRPSVGSGPVPPLMLLLLVSLVIDVAVMALASRRGSEQLSMSARVIGFIGAALIFTIMSATFAQR